MRNIYGYLDHGTFIETGLTEVGAKIAATRCTEHPRFVGYRSPINNMYIPTARTYGAGWEILSN